MNTTSGIPCFDVHGEPATVSQRWTRWRRSFELYIDSKGELSAKRKRGLLLHSAGMDVQDIYYTLNLISTEESDIFQDTLDALDNYFVPRSNVPYEKHVFRSMGQSAEEAMDQYITRLRQQAKHCEFSDTDSEIRDQIIEKCYNAELRRRFLEELSLKGNELTLNKVADITRAWETANCQAAKMGNRSTSHSTSLTTEDINAIHDRGQRHPATNDFQPSDRMTNISSRICYRCGRKGHLANDQSCPAKGKQCRKCGIIGHFGNICKAKDKFNYRKSNNQSSYTIQQEEEEPNRFAFMIGNLGNLENNADDVVLVNVGGININMLIDSGASCNVICEDTWKMCKFKNIKCTSKKSEEILKVYGNKDFLNVIGTFVADVKIGGKEAASQKFMVIKETGIPILGKKSALHLGVLKLGLGLQLNVLRNYNEWEKMYTRVFNKNNVIGKLTNCELEIPINPHVSPVIQGVRRVPFSLREPLEKLLQEYMALDIIEPVTGASTWVSPIVLTKKKTGDIRMCVDMRRANEAVVRERYPLPTIDEILQDLSGSTVFSKLDIKNAYHQVVLHSNSRDITTFTTHVGLFRYKRLMFGVSCAPEMFQRILHQVLQGCHGVSNFLDDIIVYGTTEQEHDNNLHQVLHTLQTRGIILNSDKCEFKKREIEYLGHKISDRGVEPNKDNIETILDFREPRSSEEILSFLGLVNYCARFIPDLATINEPLRKLTRKYTRFQFGEEQKKAFELLKDRLVHSTVLAFFDKDAPTKIFTDASPVGLGAVLIQVQHGVPRIISYASRSLSDVEKRYSQTEKEALGIVWACERFHMYVFGRSFDLYTDHKPLEYIYSNKSKPCARVERWVLRMQGYTYRVIYIPGNQNIADSLSRLLSPTSKCSRDCDDPNMEYVKWIASSATPSAMTTREIERASDQDDELTRVRHCLRQGFFDKDLTMYRLIQGELCSVGQILLRGTRIVIPECLKKRTLELAHEGHPGMVAMKQRLRTKVWWHGMDKDVEKFVRTCQGCQLVARNDPPEPLCRTVLPERPWEHISVDFLGPLPTGEYLMVVVDYYSRYMEIEIMTKITSLETIDKLETIFSRHGLPITMSADNSGQFRSKEILEFTKNYGIKLHNITPLYPQANGQVERQNRSILKRLQIASATGIPWRKELTTYLMMYRTTPHSVTGVAPAEMLFNRKVRSKIPEINTTITSIPRDEAVRDHDTLMKEKGKIYSDLKRGATKSSIEEGDLVLLRQERKNKLSTNFEKEPYVVTKKYGNSVQLQGCDGKRVTRNSTYVRKYIPCDDLSLNENLQLDETLQEDITDNIDPVSDHSKKNYDDRDIGGTQSVSQTGETLSVSQTGARQSESQTGARPQRQCSKPTHLKDFVCE